MLLHLWSLDRRSKKYDFSDEEMAIIRRCKKERNRDIAKILLGGAGVTALGLITSANKKMILQYASLGIHNYSS